MEDAQFLVQWDEHPTHLATRLGYLLEHQSLVDVTLMCNTHTLKVHRAVLAACSPYFERQLGNHPLIVLKDMKFSVLKSLVEFMYCGETSVSEENLTPLLEAAKFFEVKGLAAMTKESVCVPSGSHSSKSLNGTSTPNSTAFGRGCGRGRGRGRGRPPLNSSSKIGSPTESAQILLSLSGNNQSNPQFFTTSKNVKIDPSVIQNNIVSGDTKPKIQNFEPRRRGRRRGAINSAFREKLMKETDTQLAIETLKRDLSDDSDQLGSPLLSSLLSKPEVKTSKTEDASNSKYMQTLKNIGLPTNVPILLDNGEGKLVTLTEDVLRSVMDSDGNLQFHVTEGTLGDTSSSLTENDDSLEFEKKTTDFGKNLSSVRERLLNKQKKIREFLVKEMQATRSDDDDIINQSNSSALHLKSEVSSDSEDLINEAVLESLRNGAASEAEQDPEAVILLEVTGDKKVEKYVVSAKEVSALKALNEQLTKQKKQLADITRNNVSTIDVVGTNTKVAELNLKIGKTKSILTQVMECVQQGLREKLKHYSNQSEVSNDKKPQSQVVQLEFIDCNGEKIEGYQVEGTVIDKRINENKESIPKDNDLMGLFDMVCENPVDNSLLVDNKLKKSEIKVEETISSDGCVELEENNESCKDMNYQLVMNNHHLEDQSENIPYDQIEAMIGDSGDNIVIQHKSQDLKYIIDNGENMINQDDNYVVYENEKQEMSTNEYVIYDNSESVLPDISDNENPNGFVVGEDEEVIHNDEATEYIVYDEEKNDLGNDIKEIDGSDVGTQYIVYTSDENTEKSQERYELYKEDEEGTDKVNDEFVIYSGSKDSVLIGDEHNANTDEVLEDKKTSPTKDVPFAVGLVPLKDALEKIQSISDHQPRRTRSNSSSGNPEHLTGKRRSSVNSDISEKQEKKQKLDITLPEQTDCESL